MLNPTLPLFVSMHNLIFCLERVLEKAHFETVGLIHLNTSVDVADIVHQQLVFDTDYVWIRFDMSNNSTLEHLPFKDNLLTKFFFVFFLNDFIDWLNVYEFFVRTKFNHRDNQIYVVNKYPTIYSFRKMGRHINIRQLLNAAILFWNTSGYGTGLEAYRFDGFQKDIFKVPLLNDQYCCADIHNKLFPPDKFLNFNEVNVTIYGQTEPPRLVRTSAMNNGKYEQSIGGHDVLITDAIFKHLNATPKFKLMTHILYMHSHNNYIIRIKPAANTEQRFFNVSEIFRCIWNIPDSVYEMETIYTQPAIDINSQPMRFPAYVKTQSINNYTHLYPHDTDNFVIIVPKLFKSKTEYGHILKSPLVFVWIPVTIAATIIRLAVSKITKKDKNYVDVLFQTFGLSLGISFKATISSAAENLLLWWFCLGTMLSGMLLSSSMFQGFALQIDILTIRNLKELELSGLEVQAPLCSESVSHFFEDITLKLKLNYIVDYDISEMMFMRNMSNAYVVRESKFNILFGNDHDAWNVIARFGFEHLSYKLRLFSAIEHRMNTVLQRCVDHGIISYLVAKNRRLLSGTKPKVQNIISTVFKPLNINDMQNPFMLYAVGIVLSSFTFIAEKIYYKRNVQISTRKRIRTKKLPGK